MDTLREWRCGELVVYYAPELNGDGISMAPSFVDYLKQHYGQRVPFECAFEWCAGPGFIGFALLAANLCKHVVLSDINPRAVAAARQTIEKNRLHDRVTVYEGDNLSSLPTDERFDLVVSNPPNFYCLNPQHPSYTALAGDLRPNDPGWALHREFYRAIPRFLRDGAVLCIEEVDPYASKCYTPNGRADQPLYGPEPFDIRPRPPIEDFQDMISSAGLSYVDTAMLPHAEFPVHLVISTWDAAAAARWREAVALRADVQLYRGLNPRANGKIEFAAFRRGRALGSIVVDGRDARLPLLFDALAATNHAAPIKTDELFRRAQIAVSDGMALLRSLHERRWILLPGE